MEQPIEVRTKYISGLGEVKIAYYEDDDEEEVEPSYVVIWTENGVEHRKEVPKYHIASGMAKYLTMCGYDATFEEVA